MGILEIDDILSHDTDQLLCTQQINEKAQTWPTYNATRLLTKTKFVRCTKVWINDVFINEEPFTPDGQTGLKLTVSRLTLCPVQV